GRAGGLLEELVITQHFVRKFRSFLTGHHCKDDFFTNPGAFEFDDPVSRQIETDRSRSDDRDNRLLFKACFDELNDGGICERGRITARLSPCQRTKYQEAQNKEETTAE